MEPWHKPILARINGTFETLHAAETAAVRQLWEAYNGLLANRPALEASVMTHGQLAVLTRTAHMHGRTSEITRELLTAFGLAWGWPDELPEADRRFESQQILVSARPVPVAPAPAPAPAPDPAPALGSASPSPEPNGPPSGFVELPAASPVPSLPPQPVAAPPTVPDGRGERGRGTDAAFLTIEDAPPG